MKKIFIALSMVVLSSAVSATPVIKVDCNKIGIQLITIGKNDFRFVAYWDDSSKFPNPPVSRKVGQLGHNNVKPFSFICPDIQSSYDGNIATIKGESYQDVLEHLGEYFQYVDLYHYSYYKYPSIREGLSVISYSFNLSTFDIKSSIYTTNEGDNLDDHLFSSDIPKNAVIGYRVDNGELKPLLYNRKVSSYKDDLNNAKIIDIYHKLDSDVFNIGSNVDRIHIDKENGILKIYRSSIFPKK